MSIIERLQKKFPDAEFEFPELAQMSKPIEYKCPIHGWQKRTPNHLLNENRPLCVKCNAEILRKAYFDTFVKKAKIKHNNKFEYKFENFISAHYPITAICKEHGDFIVVAETHLNHSGGCPKCGDVKQRLIKKFPDVNFKLPKKVLASSNIRLKCPIHGWQTKWVANLLSDKTAPCNHCVKETKLKKEREIEFLRKAEEKHSNRFSYSSISYADHFTKINVVCSIHGNFNVTPRNHLSQINGGCPGCNRLMNNLTPNEVISAIKSKLSDDRNIDIGGWKGIVKSKVKLECPIHGWQTVRFSRFVYKNQLECQWCNIQASKPELEIRSWIPDQDNLIFNSRKIIQPLELDIFDEKSKLGIEYCGLVFHSTIYKTPEKARVMHINKLNKCLASGINLIQIFEDEYLERPEVVKSKILYLYKQHNTISARKTKIVELTYQQKSEFINNYHLQGNDSAPIRLGLEHNGELVAAMTFGKPPISGGDKKFEWSLSRYCSKPFISVVGGFNKLLSYFIKAYTPTSILTYADRRWSVGNIYEKSGFQLLRVTKPNYWYIRGNERKHRYNYRKQLLPRKLEHFDPALTEVENMENHGFNRIWDAGNLVYGVQL